MLDLFEALLYDFYDESVASFVLLFKYSMDSL